MSQRQSKHINQLSICFTCSHRSDAILMAKIYLFNKPYLALSQFTPIEEKACLKDYIDIPDIYPAGRLDYDSEGLLLLTGDGVIQSRIAHPKFKLPKTYLAQVEGDITKEAIYQLQSGVRLNDGPTAPAKARIIEEPALWERTPPIRKRANQNTSWLELIITEGRNRQVRRMTAHVGFPTLRLVRIAIGPWSLNNLLPGTYRCEDIHLPKTANHQIESRRK